MKLFILISLLSFNAFAEEKFVGKVYGKKSNKMAHMVCLEWTDFFKNNCTLAQLRIVDSGRLKDKVTVKDIPKEVLNNEKLRDIFDTLTQMGQYHESDEILYVSKKKFEELEKSLQILKENEDPTLCPPGTDL